MSAPRQRRRRSDSRLPPAEDIRELIDYGETREAIAQRFRVTRNAVNKALSRNLAPTPTERAHTS